MKKLIAEHQKKWAVCVAKAWADEDYKQRLLTDTAAVLKEEGVDTHEGMSVRVVVIEDVEERLAAMSCLCLCLLGQISTIGDAISDSLLGRG